MKLKSLPIGLGDMEVISVSKKSAFTIGAKNLVLSSMTYIVRIYSHVNLSDVV